MMGWDCFSYCASQDLVYWPGRTTCHIAQQVLLPPGSSSRAHGQPSLGSCSDGARSSPQPVGGQGQVCRPVYEAVLQTGDDQLNLGSLLL